MDVNLEGFVILADDQTVADAAQIFPQAVQRAVRGLAHDEHGVEGEGDVLIADGGKVRLLLGLLLHLGDLLAPQGTEHALQNNEVAFAAGIHHAGLLQHRTHLRVDFAQCACDAQTSGRSLSRNTTAIEVDDDVVILRRVGGQQGLLHLVLENFEREVNFKRFAVDCNLTLARLHVYASHSGLTTTYGVYNFHNSYLISFNLIVFGFCAA